MNPTTTGLDDVQGNILKGHGRKYTALLFFRFARREEAAADNRRLLRDAAGGTVEPLAITSAAGQRLHADRRRARDSGEFPFRSLGLSTHGLAACDYHAANLGITSALASDQFWGGATADLLGDTVAWQKTFTLPPDGVFLLAHAQKTELTAMVKATGDLLRAEYGIGEVVAEHGFRWTPRQDQGDDTTYEHFGFADGFARTAMVAEPSSPLKHLVEPTSGFIKDRVQPFEIPIGQVMIEEEGVFCGGSFLVVSKLEQNVQAFLEAENYLERHRAALPAGIIPSGKAGALFIGRTRDGTPLARGKTHRTDRFDFDDDPGGRRCPFSAHIRKMNPRQEVMTGRAHPQSGRGQQKASQFVRRGVLYGDEQRVKLEWDQPADAPDRDVGLMFMGYMSQIGNQFLKMYFNWGPDPRFPRDGSGADALLGGGGAPWTWPQHPGLIDPANPLTLGQFVTNKGAGFFIVPPLRWLRSIVLP